MSETLSSNTTPEVQPLPTSSEVINGFMDKRNDVKTQLAELSDAPRFKMNANELLTHKKQKSELLVEQERVETEWNSVGGAKVDEAQAMVDALNFKSTAEERVRAQYALRDAKNEVYQNVFRDMQEVSTPEQEVHTSVDEQSENAEQDSIKDMPVDDWMRMSRDDIKGIEEGVSFEHSAETIPSDDDNDLNSTHSNGAFNEYLRSIEPSGLFSTPQPAKPDRTRIETSTTEVISDEIQTNVTEQPVDSSPTAITTGDTKIVEVISPVTDRNAAPSTQEASYDTEQTSEKESRVAKVRKWLGKIASSKTALSDAFKKAKRIMFKDGNKEDSESDKNDDDTTPTSGGGENEQKRRWKARTDQLRAKLESAKKKNSKEKKAKVLGAVTMIALAAGAVAGLSGDAGADAKAPQSDTKISTQATASYQEKRTDEVCNIADKFEIEPGSSPEREIGDAAKKAGINLTPPQTYVATEALRAKFGDNGIFEGVNTYKGKDGDLRLSNPTKDASFKKGVVDNLSEFAANAKK